MNALRKLFGLCPHKWKITDRHNVNRNSDGKCVGFIVVLQCEHCGEVKTKKVLT